MPDRLLIDGYVEIEEDNVVRRRRRDAGLLLPSTPGAGLAAGAFKETSVGPLKQVAVTFDGHVVTMTDATTSGIHGSEKLFTCPLGLVMILGAHAELTILAGDGGIADDAAIVAAIGTVTTQTGNGALSSTEADIVASTAMTLAAGTDTETLISTDTECPAIFDGTTTAKDVFLNFAAADAEASDDDTLTVDGTVIVSYLQMGPF